MTTTFSTNSQPAPSGSSNGRATTLVAAGTAAPTIAEPRLLITDITVHEPVHGAQPGTWVTVDVDWETNTDFAVQDAKITLVCDGQTVVEPADVNYSGRIRVYHQGTITLAVTLTGTAVLMSGHKTLTTGPVARAFQVAFDDSAPGFTIAGPAAGAVLQLAETGTDLDFAVNTADTNNFGPRTVTVTDITNATMPQPTVALTLQPGGGSTFGGQLRVSGTPIGTRTFRVSSTCPEATDLVSTQLVTVTAVDVTAPHDIAVAVPDQGGRIVVSGDNLAIQVSGKVSDLQSTMRGGSAAVKCSSSPNGPWLSATSGSGTNDLSDWVATMTVPSLGANSLYVQAWDVAGNASAVFGPVNFEAIHTFVPTQEERLNDRFYLSQLMNFAAATVRVPDGSGTPPAVHTADLMRVLGQPLERLAALDGSSGTVGVEPINQLRLPVELLRQYLTKKAVACDTSSYLAAAYGALLAAMGTSRQELELAARVDTTTDTTTRGALATRLGLPLHPLSGTGTRPDQLDALTIDVTDPSRWSEKHLEELFGLRSTLPADQDPLRTVARSRVLQWQLDQQRQDWELQDAAAVTVDPDIVAVADVRPDSANANQVLELLSQRGAALTGFASAMQGLISGEPAAAFTSMLISAGVPLAAIISAEGTGEDIRARLTAAGLDVYGYRTLRDWHRLIGASLVTTTTSGWASIVDVLTGAHRRQQYPTWTGQESGILLSPDVFIVAAGSGSTIARSAYRVDPNERVDWETRLMARTIARQALLDGADGGVAAAEQAALPILRDLLAAAATVPLAAPAATVLDLFTEGYGVDFTANGSGSTTRLEQATASLQALLVRVRAGDDADAAIADWTLVDLTAFDTAWRWMSDAQSWRAATTAFLFPEMMIDPSILLRNATIAATEFADLTRVIRSGTTISMTEGDFHDKLDAYEKAIAADFPAKDFSYQNQHALFTLSNTLSTASMRPLDAIREVFWTAPMAIGQALENQGQYQNALDWYWIAFPYNDPFAPPAFFLVQNERTQPLPQPNLDGHVWEPDQQNPFSLMLNTAAPRTAPHLRATLLAIARCLIAAGDEQFTAETPSGLLTARFRYTSARRLLQHEAFTPVQPTTAGEGKYLVPLQQSLLQRVDAQLSKLSQNRNISGMPRPQQSDTPGAGGTQISAPTDYRYPVLLARAQRLAEQAIQIEAQYLAALEKYDNKALQESDARNALGIAQKQVAAHIAQEKEATDGVTAATDQVTKSSTMVTLYQKAVSQPSNDFEHRLFSDYTKMRDLQNAMGAVEATIGIAQAASSWNVATTVMSLGLDTVATATQMAGIAARGVMQGVINDAQAQMQANQLHSSIEERRQEFSRQLAAAAGDLQVAKDQATVAADRLTTALAETAVATAQQEQARNTLTMLQHAFTNADLYQWLSSTLGGAYRYFLQQATATARLAQGQLAFERAEPTQTYIGTDYWNSDRKGLTGAEQLSEDLSRLDAYAFSSNQRHLAIAQTFSLAQQLPLDFRAFRETGELAFSTPMSWFDQDFAHLLRLIRQVKVSVVALVPPSRGIRGTLSSTGISRVITPSGQGSFNEITLRRDPGTIAITSPINADGLDGADTQPDLLLPFEGNGVDTRWSLELPKAANPFDYSTISDVLFTVEYTALASPAYQDQLRRRLNASPARTGDCMISLAQDCPDQWYDLHNPADPTQPRTVTLTLRDIDFPPNLGAPKTTALVVHLDTATPPDPVQITLSHGALPRVAATDSTGTISTRRGAPDWSKNLLGTTSTGDWQFTFDASAADLFDDDRITDILFDVTWSAPAPLWRV